ncbi:autophagy-related protein 3-like [Carya illinoinensis]|uniref:autophagy-related protein 3-like n=1 Tax=Carya illinoinensis TaxID=32201 RepID=UPI001C7253B6|nr:autophagy-related protein 3-like [Carya illinoinensis]
MLAGNNLVSKCPTWSWESGEPSKRKPYLPPEKQFLITRNVPCLRRAASVEEEYEVAGGEVLLDGEDNDCWLATHGKPKENKHDEDDDLPSMETIEISQKNPIQSIPSYYGVEEGEDIPDMAEYDEPDNLIETEPEHDEDNILRTRTYDVSIT